MSASSPRPNSPDIPGDPVSPSQSWLTPALAAFSAWLVISAGFYGLQVLMEQRPQFAGQPMHSLASELIQDSPKIVLRRVNDDVSVFQETRPDSSDISFELGSRRDYRGLKTVVDLQTSFIGRFTFANPYDEPIFLLFRCPHPQAAGEHSSPINANALQLTSSVPGLQESGTNTWLWSGELAPRTAAQITVSYQAAALQGVQYRLPSSQTGPIKTVRVSMTSPDPASLRFESADGLARPEGNRVSWEKQDFLPPGFFSAKMAETRGLYTALMQLVQIGPVVCLLCLTTLLAFILATRALTVLQVFTLAAGYAFYFPLILYLSAKFSFPLALGIATILPGALLLNYARWLLGVRRGVFGGVLVLLLYQVFPTLAAFSGWNRGMVLLALGGVTLFVLINLQNQALKRQTSLLFPCWFLLLFAPPAARAQDLQVLVPAHVLTRSNPSNNPPAEISFGVASYQITATDKFYQINAAVPIEVLRPGQETQPLFVAPAHITSWSVPECVRVLVSSNGFALKAISLGTGAIQVEYRAPIERENQKAAASVPLLSVPAGQIVLRSPHPDLEFQQGALWEKQQAGDATQYSIGVAGTDRLLISSGPPNNPALTNPNPSQLTGSPAHFYGIRITESQQLTVIHSDGGCAHFAEFVLPPFHPAEFPITLPEGAVLISAALDGTELARPPSEPNRLIIPLERPAQGKSSSPRRLSLRLNYPPMRLGFIGFAELALPRAETTIGTLRWVIALPHGFHLDIISSGLENHLEPADLSGFGDYARILKTHPQVSLSKNLLPPAPVRVRFKYAQQVP